MLVAIVDDIPENRKYLASLVKNNTDYNVMLSESGKDLIEYLHRDDPQIPDIILLDIMLPEMNGFETAERIKSISYCVDVPIIFITALNDDDSIKQAFSRGGIDYISKPVHKEELLARLKVHLDLKRSTLELKKKNAELTDERELLRKRGRELRGLYRTLKLMEEVTDLDALLGSMVDHVIPEAMTWSDQVIAMIVTNEKRFITRSNEERLPGFTVKAQIRAGKNDFGELIVGYDAASGDILTPFEQKLIHAFASHLAIIIDKQASLARISNINEIIGRFLNASFAKEGILILNAENKAIYHNDRFFDVFGIDRKDFKKDSIGELSAGLIDMFVDPQRLIDYFRSFYDSDESMDIEIMSKNGETFSISGRVLSEKGIVFGKVLNVRVV